MKDVQLKYVVSPKSFSTMRNRSECTSFINSCHGVRIAEGFPSRQLQMRAQLETTRDGIGLDSVTAFGKFTSSELRSHMASRLVSIGLVKDEKDEP